MGFLRASVAFSLAWLVLDDWLQVADWLEVAIVWLIAAFIIDAWRGQGAAPDRDRWGLVAGFVAALAGFAMPSAHWSSRWPSSECATDWRQGAPRGVAGVPLTHKHPRSFRQDHTCWTS
jgi:hypothetical protein